MGQFEKIVVLSVIGLIAVILVVSFSGSEDPLAGGPALAAGPGLLEEGELHGPLPAGPRPIRGRTEDLGAGELEAELSYAPAPDALDVRDPFEGEGREGPGEVVVAELEQRPAPSIQRDQLKLSAEVLDPLAEEEARRLEGLPADAALITLRGLEDTWEADLKQYTCRSGDGLQKLARRFYGDAAMEGLLRQYNEGVVQLREGQVLLVPVFDLRAPGAVAQAPSPAPTPTPTPAVSGGGGVHIVGEGENLWGIAVTHYGRGSDWQRIYDANRDRLSNPDAVRAGMTLQIP